MRAKPAFGALRTATIVKLPAPVLAEGSMRFKLLQIDTLFPVPLCSFALPDAAAINATLEAEIAVRRASEPGLEVSNRGGWHSVRDRQHHRIVHKRRLCLRVRALRSVRGVYCGAWSW